MISTLDHLILAVRDLDAAARSYTRLLGRTPSWRGEHPGEGTANVLYRLENTYVELLAPCGEGSSGSGVRAWLEHGGEGLVGMAFGTSDIEACQRAFGQRGLEPGPVSPGLGRDVESGAFRKWQTVALPAESTRGVFTFAIEHEGPEDVLPPSGFLGDEGGCVRGVDHVVVQTHDPEAAKVFYGEGLGLRLALDLAPARWGSRMLFFRVGGVTVEVVSSPGPGESGDAEAQGEGPDRLVGLCWRVGDAEVARGRLAEAGLSVSSVRDGRKEGTRVFSVRDGSCGVPTLILEPA